MNSKLLNADEKAKLCKDWTSFFFSGDLFSRSYCGYWLQWKDDQDSPEEFDERTGEAITYFNWDQETAEKAYHIGERLWGENWYGRGDTDSTSYDIVIQYALLGEVKYG